MGEQRSRRLSQDSFRITDPGRLPKKTTSKMRPEAWTEFNGQRKRKLPGKSGREGQAAWKSGWVWHGAPRTTVSHRGDQGPDQMPLLSHWRLRLCTGASEEPLECFKQPQSPLKWNLYCPQSRDYVPSLGIAIRLQGYILLHFTTREKLWWFEKMASLSISKSTTQKANIKVTAKKEKGLFTAKNKKMLIFLSQ